MRLSVSNIAWSAEHDKDMYEFLGLNDFSGLEIAPSRIFPNMYKDLNEAAAFSNMLKNNYGLSVPSIQSIWFGVKESLFGKKTERQYLTTYMKRIIDFAKILSCGNIVFGCPKNRVIPDGTADGEAEKIAADFFTAVGNYAALNETHIAIEANPPIYSTNFINTTTEAFALCKKLNNPGIKVNIDLGAMVYNKEGIEVLKGNWEHINHIHISEPYLAAVEAREMHNKLKNEMAISGYNKYVSLEMTNPNNIEMVKEKIIYLKKVFR